MRILGIDPGLRATGYGLIESQNTKIKLLEAGTIEPKTNNLIERRINTIFKNLDDLVDQYNPQVMVLEKLYTHYRHPTTAALLGHVRGVICLLCAQKNMRLEECSPKRIRKALVGNGNASKQQTKSVVARALGIDEDRLTLDASDALALSLGYLHLQRHKL